MSQSPDSTTLIPAEGVAPGAEEFARSVHNLMDGKQKDDSQVAGKLDGQEAMLDLIAASQYNLASMLVGEGEQSVLLVEQAIAAAEVSVCCDPVSARKATRKALCKLAIELLVTMESDLSAPKSSDPCGSCIEDDDLAGAGISGDELDKMLQGPERQRVRSWLESLPAAVRTIFVLRAVAGFSAAEAADLLRENGGPKAQGWTADSVRLGFREGLCSLASQLLQATR